MNNKWLWLVAGIVIGVYVVPMLKARSAGA